MEQLEELQRRIRNLEEENEYLKGLLDKAGITYTSDMIFDGMAEKGTYDPNQGVRILPAEITRTMANRFYSYFWGRMDVFGKRSQNKTTGKAGYYPQCDNFWCRGICPKASGAKIKCRDCRNRKWTKLEAYHIEAHLHGNKPDASDVIGIYPLLEDGTCRFLVFDFDNHEKGADDNDYANTNDVWKTEVGALRTICRNLGIPVLVERSRSGRGAHIWIFFENPVEASLARKFGYGLLEKGKESVNLTSFRYYDRMLPAQDGLPADGIGNLIALPLQGMALKDGNSAFIDEDWNAYPNQWKTLFDTKKLSPEKLKKYIKEWATTEVEVNQKINKELPPDSTKPWEKKRSFHREDVSEKMHIVLGNQIYVKADNLKPRLQNQIRRLAAFSNPIFYKNNAIGLSNYANSRFIYLGCDDNGYICIPRGLLDELLERCESAQILYELEDKRSDGLPIHADFEGTLRENQTKAVQSLLQYDNGILSAATAFGKTVVCSNIISQKKTSTLILLESSSLIEQWQEALEKFLRIDEEMPEYKTKTGRTKKRRNLIGIIQGPKDTSTGIVDIAMAGSLIKKGEYHPRLKEYGLVLVDECHHSASDTVRSVLQEVNAKYIYGVTATPFRGDGLEQINEMLLGPVRFQYTAKEKAAEQGISHLVVPRFTRAVSPHGREKLHVNEAYEIIRDNEVRNNQICTDIKKCIEQRRTPVVLSKYTEHAAELYERVKACADKVFLLTGKKSKKEQSTLREEMLRVQPQESMILIATGQLIGEGFDYPRLDTLILATPVSWKGVVEQYAGRLNRDYEGKQNVMIYDYVDAHIPVFDKMYAKRLKSYKRIGYKLASGNNTDKQDANAIFDSDTYKPIYEQDLAEVQKELVISSPALGSQKVYHLIRILQERQEAGVRVTIVTWHPDVYRYGSDEHRIELMEALRNAGVHIELVEDNCEHFAVIDNEIVWYGSMNLLSRDDVEDNIMRVVSKDIAAELLEITFRKDNELQEYQLPL